MRGAFEDQGGLFSYISPEARIPASHPLRKIRELVREVLGELNAWEAVVLPLNYARDFNDLELIVRPVSLLFAC
jgi:hypothetical protein